MKANISIDILKNIFCKDGIFLILQLQRHKENIQ